MKNTIIIIAVLLNIIHVSAQDSETFKDVRDSRIYRTVKIAKQVWMAENLAFKADSGCWAYDNKEENVKKYGRLYNWNTAMNSCPSGWHLPNYSEWKILTDNLEGFDFAGEKMKAKTSDWIWYENVNATNESGFSGIPAGYYYYYEKSFRNMGKDATWWCATLNDDGKAWVMYLYYNYNEATLYYSSADYGCSVRCIKNEK